VWANANILGNPLFHTFDEQRQRKLLSGEVLYVRGLRAGLRDAGFPDNWLELIYGPLSAFSHAAPFAYAEPEARRFDDDKSAYAHYVAALSLGFVKHIMTFVAIRVHKVVPCAWCTPFQETI
jgi:hypothetical protein